MSKPSRPATNAFGQPLRPLSPAQTRRAAAHAPFAKLAAHPMLCPTLRPEPVSPAICGGPAPDAGPVRPDDTVASLAARIRAKRCGGPDGSRAWLYSPEKAAEMMIWAERQRKRLERYAR